jgi:hypothetical protein
MTGPRRVLSAAEEGRPLPARQLEPAMSATG